MRVTGITFAVIDNVNENSAVRTFLDDPSARFREDGDIADVSARPRPRALRHFCAFVDEHNPLFGRLRTWHDNAGTEDAWLVLQWEGVAQGLRSFTMTPSAANPLPRTALVFSRDRDEGGGQPAKFYLKLTNDTYPLAMWPLAFPRGERLCFADGWPVDDWLRQGVREDGRKINIQQATLALLLQPERRSGMRADVEGRRAPTDEHARQRPLPLTAELGARVGERRRLRLAKGAQRRRTGGRRRTKEAGAATEHAEHVHLVQQREQRRT